ncbi:S41 family peptidase [Holophaga foetida]|uniref:S41 family peptidase n=1 Tax=Holophaga foetida TaxID=35839 RepID=UPI000247175C|nr:PDZ domain-containing protein [Holophaga foetida]
MHQRTWFSLITLPLVAGFTYPVVFQKAAPALRAESAQGSKDPLAGLADIQDVLSLVRDNYVDVPDLEKVIQGGVQAVLERAHPLNAYLSPDDLRLPDPGPAEFGIKVVKRQIYAQIVAVVPGSPAARAGIQVGDVLRKLDGESIGPMSSWTLERRLRGAIGSSAIVVLHQASSGDLKTLTLNRELPVHAPIAIRKETQATVLSLPDLTLGRADELKALLSGLDHKLPLVLDLRQCATGDLQEAALIAGFFLGDGPFATIQEVGKGDRLVRTVAVSLEPFPKLAVLQGVGTLGAPEALVSAFKKQGVPTFGDRTAALGVERSRFTLRTGAAEIVNRRWVGVGGEKLGFGGEKSEQAPGVAPQHALKGLKPEEDPLPKVLEILLAPPTDEKKPGAQARLGLPVFWFGVVSAVTV